MTTPHAVGAHEVLVGLVDQLRALGVERIRSFAWRDLDDPEAGGSEVHADEIFARWAAAGLTISHHTSTFDHPRSLVRRGYSVHQAGGRLGVLVRSPWRGWRSRRDTDAVIDIWNGVPWWSRVWFRGPQVTWLHHVHGPMWRQSFPAPLAAIGRWSESVLAARVYRRSRVVTLAGSSAEEIVDLGFAVDRVCVIPPGLHVRFSADATQRCPTPHVVIVGRLAPVKRVGELLRALAAVRARVPDLTVTVVGDGPDRPAIEEWCRSVSATWVHLAGRLDDAALVAEYRKAWLIASASVAEGWAMVLTEAAACGTPAVATDVAGHRDSVIDGMSGVLAPGPAGVADAVAKLLVDEPLLARLSAGAIERAGLLTWDAAAVAHLQVLLDEARRHRQQAGKRWWRERRKVA